MPMGPKMLSVKEALGAPSMTESAGGATMEMPSVQLTGPATIPEPAPVPGIDAPPPAPRPEDPEIAEVRGLMEPGKAPKAGGAYRVNPETFFGPVIAALISTGQSPDTVMGPARLAYQSCLALADEVVAGRFDARLAIEALTKRLASRAAACDSDAQKKKREHDVLHGKIGTLAGDDPRVERYQKDLLDLKRAYTQAKNEHDRITKIVLPAIQALPGFSALMA